MFKKEKALDKQLKEIKSELEQMMKTYQAQADSQMQKIYQQEVAHLASLATEDDAQLLQKVRENLSKEAENRQKSKEEKKELLKKLLTTDIVTYFSNPEREVKEKSFDLERFVVAQSKIYPYIVEELKAGKKKTHWMWFIFPQIKGVGKSETAKKYAIVNFDEAKAYLKHPILGKRLKQCSVILLKLPHNLTAKDILGSVNARRLWASISLFYLVEQSKNSIYFMLLDKFFNGAICPFTKKMLDNEIPQ